MPNWESVFARVGRASAAVSGTRREYSDMMLVLYWEGSLYAAMSELNDSVVCTIASPMRGEVCPLEEVPDPAFSRHIIGDGVAIIPDDSEVLSPADGRIVSVFETKHAIIFEKENNIRILLHVGIGSMRLQGQGFTSFVDNGQEVKSGDKLLSVDINYVEKRADALASPIVLTSPQNTYRVNVVAKGHIEVGDPLFEVVALTDEEE